MPRLLLAALLLATLIPSARAGEDDYYISMPSLGALYLLDAETGALSPVVVGFSVPFYGVWATDGFLYIPDQEIGAVFQVGMDGSVTPFTAGGFLATPVTVAESPDAQIYVSDLFSGVVARVDPDGTQHLVHDQVTSGGLLDGPGGLGFDLDGILYVSNNVGNNVVAIDPSDNSVWQVSDGGGLLDQPGGLALDGAGNLFISNYAANTIVRIRVDTGEAELFSDDAWMVSPNDVKLSRKGGLLVTTKNSSLLHFDALGQMTIIANDPGLGAWDGVAVPADNPPCDGRFIEYGQGTPGSGGITPSLRGIFTPCVGAHAALELKGFLGGAVGALFWGLASGAVPFKQGTLHIDVGGVWGQVPLVMPGVGPGGGSFRLPFTYPADPLLEGVSLFVQVLASDPAAPGNVSMSNGLEERIGS